METQGTEDLSLALSPVLTPCHCPWADWQCLQCPFLCPCPFLCQCSFLCQCPQLPAPPRGRDIAVPIIASWLWEHSQENWCLCRGSRAVLGTRKCFSTELSEFPAAERRPRFGNSWTDSKLHLLRVSNGKDRRLHTCSESVGGIFIVRYPTSFNEYINVCILCCATVGNFLCTWINFPTCEMCQKPLGASFWRRNIWTPSETLFLKCPPQQATGGETGQNYQL